MNKIIKDAFWSEVDSGRSLYINSSFDKAFQKFERAHILGQSNVLLHTYSHICMLKIGFAKKDFKEILGQLLRIPSGFLGSMIGFYPEGNTGGSNISAFKKLKIPEDLEKILNSKEEC